MKKDNDEVVRDETCEKSLIGTLMINETLWNEAKDLLSEECFYNVRHKDAYKALCQMAEKGMEFGIINFMTELRSISDIYAQNEFVYYTDSKSVYMGDIPQYCNHLKELAARRRIWNLGQMLIGAGTSETQEMDDVLRKLSEGIAQLPDGKEGDGVCTLRDAYRSLTGIMVNNVYHKEVPKGTMTGFREIDRRGGLQPTDLIVVAGSTSNGKSSFALSVANRAINTGRKIVFYSMEMSKEQLAARMAAMNSGVASSDILYSDRLTPDQMNGIQEAMDVSPAENLFFDDKSTSSLDSILNSIRRMKARHDIDGAIVDYIQILNVNTKTGNAEQAMGDAARRLKNIAKELGIWVMALSQLSRNNDSPVPTMSRLRQSGQIEEAADNVILIYRPELYDRSFPEPFQQCETDGYALINMAKGRNIGVFRFIAAFRKETTQFSDVEGNIPARQRHTSENAPF